MNRQEKGITLIALVITILILVILVGVSVTAAINTGLIQNSKNAVANYSEKQKQEEAYLDNVAKMMEIYSMEEVKAGEYTGASNKKYVDNGKTAYIPAGFTVSNVEGETSINKGLVIYSNVSNDSNITDTAEQYMAKIKSGQEGYTVETLQATYNQYVWIPVENPSDMYGTKSDGNKYGKLYEFKKNATSPEKATPLNWYQEVTDEEVQQAQEEYDAQYNEAVSLVSAEWDSLTSEQQSEAIESMKTEGFTGTTQDELFDFAIKMQLGDRPTKESIVLLKNSEYYQGYREPAYLNDADNADDSEYNVDVDGNKIITKEGIQDEFNKMINSVETYKGFYIGRYELTGTVDNPTVVKGATPLASGTSYSVNDMLRWYGSYSMCEKIEEENDKVHTTMMWGCQLSQTIKMSLTDKSNFISSQRKDFYEDYLVDYEYYYLTGNLAAFNIFDLVGGNRELSLVGFGEKSRSYIVNGFDITFPSERTYDAYFHEFEPSDAKNDIVCRPQLYL